MPFAMDCLYFLSVSFVASPLLVRNPHSISIAGHDAVFNTSNLPLLMPLSPAFVSERSALWMMYASRLLSASRSLPGHLSYDPLPPDVESKCGAGST